MARARTGTLILKKTGFFARIWVDVDGKGERRWFDLETTDRTLARRKMVKLVKMIADGSAVAVAADEANVERVADLAWPWNERRKSEGVVMWSDEKIHLRDFILPAIGAIALVDVRRSNCQDVIDDAARRKNKKRAGQKLGFEYLNKIRGTMSRLFKEARRQELIAFDPVELVTIPKNAKRGNPPEQFTDLEASVFFGDRLVDVEIKVLSLVARVEAGMRTGELNRWDWTNIEKENFSSCDIYRSKTGDWQTGIEIPAMLRPWMREWWLAHGSPESGPVFPVRHGKNKGAFKAARGTSYAKRLRDAFEGAMKRADVAVRPALLKGTPHTSRCNFHSWRHAFNSAMANSGVNMQTAMSLASHSDAKTHMRYVASSAAMKLIPASALPQFKADTLLILSLPVPFDSEATHDPAKNKYARSDSNRRHSASKADALSS